MEVGKQLDEALEGDKRDPIELMEGEIPSELRASLKRLYTDPDCWQWDDGEWDWELSLRDAQQDVDCGYVAIVPLKDGHRFRFCYAELVPRKTCPLPPTANNYLQMLAIPPGRPHCGANFPDGLLKRLLVRALIAWWSPKPVPVDRAGPTIMSAEPESCAAACWAHARRKFFEALRVSAKALN